MRREPIQDRAAGRWPGIMSALGILDAKQLRGRGSPCPMCGGKDRFTFDDKGGSGSWICRVCDKSAKGVELVMRAKGVPFIEAVKMIEGVIGGAPETSRSRRPAPGGKTSEDMAALWQRGGPVRSDDMAGRYLAKRGCWMQISPLALRLAPDERYFDDGRRPSFHPCMVAKVLPSDRAAEQGEKPALHRTYLDSLGGKADLPTPRKMMGPMPTGAAVRLMPHGDILGVGEGIETCLSASILHNVPVWACLNDGLLAAWEPPPDVKVVVIFADHDASFAGQAAAFALAKRLFHAKLTVSVEMPPRMGEDWNDVLLRQRGGAS